MAKTLGDSRWGIEHVLGSRRERRGHPDCTPCPSSVPTQAGEKPVVKQGSSRIPTQHGKPFLKVDVLIKSNDLHVA